MTDLKPEDLVKLREIAQESADYRDRIRAQGFEPGPDAVMGRFEVSFTPEVCLSLLADRARMEKALRDLADGYNVNHTSKWARDTARQALGASQ